MKISRTYEFKVTEDYASNRVDSFLSSNIYDLSRSALTGPDCEIFINGKPSRKSDRVKENDTVMLFYNAEVFDHIEPQDLPLEVLYEDSSMLVINKAQGMVVHPGAGNINGTVVNALAYRYGEKLISEMADECDIARPGIVHRLDKDTSGVLVIALTAKAHENLAMQFQNREVSKRYTALCDGVFTLPSGTVEFMMGRDSCNRKLFSRVQSGGKLSKSEYRVIRQYGSFALTDVRIFTGRTHQIRVHMKSLSHPVIGDVLYNNRANRYPEATLMLHSHILEIYHPVTGVKMHFEAPVPQRFEDFIKRYGESR
ncbi:MAG: RluA family pseudouridine synthase [Sphaerochaetaceae bacterium]|nr:RluA family pseudouridine synthase [Sphaerochaetaceae bacterium]